MECPYCGIQLNEDGAVAVRPRKEVAAEVTINKRCCVQCDRGGAGSLEDQPYEPECEHPRMRDDDVECPNCGAELES